MADPDFAKGASGPDNPYSAMQGGNLAYLGGASASATASGTGSSAGWSLFSGTLSYTSADGPTGVIASSDDQTANLGVGSRIKLTQTTTKFFIVTAITSSAITVYGGTDYTLANAAISTPYYSREKSPVGFNTSPLKWTETLTDTSNRTQATPTQNVWYNPGALSLSIPIGAWDVTYSGVMGTTDTSGNTDISSTLSTANNSESDTGFSSFAYYSSASATHEMQKPFTRRKQLLLAAKTSYYANIKTGLTTSTTILLSNGNAPLTVRAVCAYL